MNLDRCCSLIAAIVGFAGAMFIALGTFKVTPTIMARQVGTYWDFNPSQLLNITRQKADVICGVVLVGAAFLVQIATLLFVPEDLRVLESHLGCVLVSVAICCLVVAVVYWIDLLLRKRYERETRKVLAARSLKQLIEKTMITGQTPRDVEESARVIVGFERTRDETFQAFLNRYADFLGVQLTTQGIDWDRLGKK